VVTNPIVANDDTLPGTGGSVLGNDTLSGSPVTTTNTDVTPSTNGPLSIDANGNVSVAVGTPSGTYTITYTLCETGAVPANCDTAIATVVVTNVINAVNDSATTSSGATGVTGIINVFNNDTYNGGSISLSQVILTVVTPDPTGHIILNADGTVDVLPGTPSGTYQITYSICEALAPSNCSIAMVTIVVGTVDDLVVYTHLTPNGDGHNDVFFIDGINKFPDNTVEIYNRWGVLVFEVSGYNNEDKVFRGESNGRVTVNREEQLPEGTYYYILRYTNSTGQVIEKASYLYINR
jgi:gliding motility-associated-like protein